MRSRETPLRRRLAKQLSGCILDCGIGDGVYTRYLDRHGNKLVGIDIDAESVRAAGSGAIQATCSQLPFKDCVFDAVWACAVIEHVREDVLPEMIRVTRPGGRIVALTPNPLSPYDPLKRVAGMETWPEMEGHVRLWRAAELARYGEVHGETRFLPFLNWMFWRIPRLAHLLILDVQVTSELKLRFAGKEGRFD